MTSVLSTTCCIAGGGPAGMMLGLLLARAGVAVIVLEKHTDFLRDFRGDTIHPSTLAVMHDLGLLDRFLKLPHQRVERLDADVYGQRVTIADFRHLRTPCPYIALMPQWDFLDFLAEEARAWPNFRLLMGTRADAVIERDGAVVGVRASSGEQDIEITAQLVVAADGRHSTLRDRAGLPADDLGAPIDVLWFRLPRDAAQDVEQTGGYVRAGVFLVTINRGSYWQCGYVIAKGGNDALRAEGLDALKARIADAAPFLKPALQTLRSWDDLSLLSVQVNRLRQWQRDGLLCIGDAAHAMSPVGGVGINLAVQDAVAGANLLGDVLRQRRPDVHDLARVQRRRAWPTRVTQALQIAIQNTVLAPALAAPADTATHKLPLALQLLRRMPLLSRVPARVIGIGVRPERVRSAAK